jgi:hypothetical protein
MALGLLVSARAIHLEIMLAGLLRKQFIVLTQ